MPELADHHADDLAGFGSGGGGDPGGAKLGDLPACPVGAAINALVAAEALWIIAASLTLALRKPQASLPEDDHAGG
jgi:hypothetical protein